MHIHWKSLIGFGFIFWLLLCLNDFLGGNKPNARFHISDFDEIYDEAFVEKLVEQKLQTKIGNVEYRGIKSGWSLLLWNSLAFIFSIVFCACAKMVSSLVWKLYNYRHKSIQDVKTSGSITDRSVANLSRIPIMVKSNSTIGRCSDTNVVPLKHKITSDSSCPNLFAMHRSGSSVSEVATRSKCRTLFKNNCINLKFEPHLEQQCAKLRDEMLKLQAGSMKEHAGLSRKLEAVTREKRELSKQLAMTQKENRAAKQQLEEMLQEKGVLLRRLDNATKEFKCNTKTKKFALAKLEEVTMTVENLRQQLEQVSRDKEILENKLRVLESEYEKLQERLIINQKQDSFVAYHEHTPERDLSGKQKEIVLEMHRGLDHPFGDSKPPSNMLTSVSQTELDMKKIQIKIQQLEKNLENFNVTNSEYTTRGREESDISLSVRGNHTDSQVRTDEESDEASETPFMCSPRFRYWGGRAGDMVGRKDQYAKIQALATKMHEKVRFLENIKERCENTHGESSSPESMEDLRPPTRIVSSSAAFQNFLKTLHSSESMKWQFGSQSDFYF